MVEREGIHKRLTAVFDFYQSQIESGAKLGPKAAFMFKMVLQEAILELDEIPGEFLEKEFAKVTALWYWASTGRIIRDVPMPEGFWDHVGMIPDLTPVVSQVMELESGEPDQ